MTLHFLEVAKQELDETVAFYESQAPGLGQAFLSEMLASLELIRRYPTAWQSLSVHTRRCRLRRFPYGIIYHSDRSKILIIAVAHLHRRPGYWSDRLTEKSNHLS